MPADYEKLIDDLLAYEGDALTAWEVEFIDSIDKQRCDARHYGNRWSPTAAQAEVLDRLETKL